MGYLERDYHEPFYCNVTACVFVTQIVRAHLHVGPRKRALDLSKSSSKKERTGEQKSFKRFPSRNEVAGSPVSYRLAPFSGF